MTSPQQTAVLNPASGHNVKQRTIAAATLTFLVLLSWTILLQLTYGSYSTELSGYPDEPAHYVTGLMIRDYIASGFHTSPMKFAEDYYLHYPKVAFGMWGPLPHVLEGAWMLIFSPSRTSILILMALITTILAFSFATIIRNEFGTVAGLAAGVAFLSVRYVKLYAGMVMADNLCALMDFWAIIFFGRYLDHERRRDAALFGVFAGLSILTKGNGVSLALLPPFTILLTRRFDLVKRINFWIPALLVALFVGPWQYVSARLLSGSGFRYRNWSIAAIYGQLFLDLVGPWLLAVVLVGIYARVVRPFRAKAIGGIWAAAAAFLPSFWIFHSVVPSAGAEPRYMVAVTGPMLMFLVAGIAEIAAWLPLTGFSFRSKATAVASALAVVFLATAFMVSAKPVFGFVDAAAAINLRPDLHDAVMLVSSEGDGEGMLIAEVAMHDHRPGHIVLRASKMLARSDWDGNRYEPLRPTPEETAAYLDSVPVQVLIIDKTWSRQPLAHHRSLIKMLTMYPNRWQAMGTYPQHPAAGRGVIEVYRRMGTSNQPRSKVRVDLRYTLGRYIEE